MTNLVYRQHFVSAGYLRAWKDDNKHLTIFNKNGILQKDCSENCKYFWKYNLYDATYVTLEKIDNGKLKKKTSLCDLVYANDDGILSDKIQCKNHIENFLKMNEDKFYFLRDKIRNGYTLKFKDWNFLIWFMCLMIYRNPYNFNMFDKMEDLQKTRIFESGIYCSEIPLIPIPTFIHDVRQLYRKLKKLSCCLFFSLDNYFYTSDVPVISYSDGSYFFPISPYIALFVYDEEICVDIKLSNKSYVILTQQGVNIFNNAMVKACKFCYICKHIPK